MKIPNGKWQILFHWQFSFTWGWWPRSELPVFYYWCIGPVEIRHLMPPSRVWEQYQEKREKMRMTIEMSIHKVRPD